MKNQDEEKTTIRRFEPKRVRPLPGQPRKRFAGIEELASSIQEVGQITPGLVTLVTGDPNFDAQLVDGERRLRACRIAGKPFRAEVRADGDAESIFALSFASNFGKQNHDPIEIAEGCARLKNNGKTVAQIAQISGKSPAWVSLHLLLLKLHPSVQDMMVAPDEDKRISFQHGLELSRLPQDVQIRLGKRIIAGGLTVKQMRRVIDQERHRLGVPREKRDRDSSLASLEKVLDKCADGVFPFCDMTAPELGQRADRMHITVRRALALQLRELAEDLKALSESIEARCGNGNPAAARNLG